MKHFCPGKPFSSLLPLQTLLVRPATTVISHLLFVAFLSAPPPLPEAPMTQEVNQTYTAHGRGSLPMVKDAVRSYSAEKTGARAGCSLRSEHSS